MIRRTLSRLVPVFLSLAALTAAAPAADHVDNPARPAEGRADVTLRELWRVGGEDDDVIFGLVPRVGTDAAGNVHVLDSQMCQVSVYDPRGHLLRTVFREGDGPGEIRAPRDLILMPDGRVGLVQEFPGQVAFVDAQGDPAGRTVFGGGAEGGMHAVNAGLALGDRLLLSGTHIAPGDGTGVSGRTNFLELCGADGVVTARFAANETRYDFGDFHFIEREHLPPFWWAFAATDDGTVYTISDRDRYLIEAYRADGTLLRTFGRAYEPLARTDADRGKLVAMVKSAFNGVPIQPTVLVEDMEEVVCAMGRGLQVHADGSLWVLTGRGMRPGQPGVMAVYDVFAPDGRFVRQVALRAPHDARKVGIFLSGADRVVVVKGFYESLAAQFGNGATFAGEDGEVETPEIVCYEMVR